MVFGRVTSGQAVVDAVEPQGQSDHLAVPELVPRTTSVCASLRGSGGLATLGSSALPGRGRPTGPLPLPRVLELAACPPTRSLLSRPLAIQVERVGSRSGRTSQRAVIADSGQL